VAGKINPPNQQKHSVNSGKQSRSVHSSGDDNLFNLSFQYIFN
jgi:hypothetical protein